MPVKAEPTNLDPYPMLTALTSGKIKLAILVALHDTQTPMTLYQLSDATGIHYNSLRRILPQLETDGYLTADLPPEQRGRKRTNTWQLNPAGLTQAQHELSQLNSPQHN
ncbi:MAG: helix-turn-helix domain-containing protein [Propionibacteriaceae bacterium]|nr:helix-turn-helix domain-containing protein [Propionibacteriaceae bacterium]